MLFRSVDAIGIHHPRFGEQAAGQDTTGRSRTGRNYMLALQSWLKEDSPERDGREASDTDRQVRIWLGNRDDDKVRLVRFLLARLQWKSVEEHRVGGRWSELEFQAERVDTCHYSFPGNLELLLQGIGTLKARASFEGCGSYSSETEMFVNQEFGSLCEWLETASPANDLGLGTKEPFRIWLIACLAKTIKESVHLSKPIPRIAGSAQKNISA